MDFTRDEIETGRKLFAGAFDFFAGADKPDALPAPKGIEVAFAGRSNVGKSSLINALTNRKNLARVSITPGRTQQINFFQSSGPLVLADLPGYGYAKAAKEKVKAWTGFVRVYLQKRVNLGRVIVLIDARHGIKPVDTEMLDEFDKAAVGYMIVLTKADEVKAADLPARVAETGQAIAKRPAAFPAVFATSSHTGAGIPEVRAAIVRLMRERGF
ncbi:MAG: ribosome biogenesis GTP-binding protein YihA/YsxC [Xanthobacteraceae bacterium]|nr:ribosome biogenesis GTP-binding protein YihA/YsxC [Xanthobacteraceae bacterium]QYK45311.1 MAG: ribosome biogenesis GTP-binding protein YihA/YsxC [Xanthobacteraceae bacterium]